MPVTYRKETPSQTAGPYVHIGTVPSAAGLPVRTQEKPNVLASSGVDGQPIRIEGIIHDGAGDIVRDAMIELWQADPQGRHDNPSFLGWGRAAADFDTGEWVFETVKPGPTAFGDGHPQAPHVNLLLFARGINIQLHTRMYFADEAEANAADPVLAAVGAPEARDTLIAGGEQQGGVMVYRFEIRLQGEGETVFFDA